MMKYNLLIILFLTFSNALIAQETYTMGYEKMDIRIIDPNFFSEYQLSGQPSVCGIYDKESATFYSCNYETYRNIDEDLIEQTGKDCCTEVDFDPAIYYGTLTFQGIIDSVEWDSLKIHFVTDKARLLIKTDEREIDALYKNFYEKGNLGKVHIKCKFITFDTPKENTLSYNRNTEIKVKPKRNLIRVLRW
jgi:hypothetical protein